MQYQPGRFCAATLAIPEDVSTAVYSEQASSQNSGRSYSSSAVAALQNPRPRLCYIEYRISTESNNYLYQLHFCTSFKNQLITTQFTDVPDKRNEFLPIGATPKFNENEPLAIEWDRTPAYLYLKGQVAKSDIMRPPRPPAPPELDILEQRRLTSLIADRNAVKVEAGIPPPSPPPPPPPPEEEDCTNRSNRNSAGGDANNGNSTTAQGSSSSYNKKSYASAVKGNNDDSKTRRIRQWLTYVESHDHDEDTDRYVVDAASKAGYHHDDHDLDDNSTWSPTPSERAAYNNAMEDPFIDHIPTVILSSLYDVDPSLIRYDEEDPIQGFLHEVALLKSIESAIHKHAVCT